MKKSVTVLLNGGLGNQMYQYSFGRSLSIKHKCKLNLDVSIFDTFTTHGRILTELNNFKIHSDTIISKNFNSFQLLNLRLITKIFRKNVIKFNFSKLILNKKFNKIFFDWDFKKREQIF